MQRAKETVSLGGGGPSFDGSYAQGLRNVFIGEGAASQNKGISDAVSIGSSTLQLGGGNKSVYIGAKSGVACSDASDCRENVVVGSIAGNVSTGSYNTFLGYNTVGLYALGSYNTIVGSSAIKPSSGDPSHVISDNVIIGYSAVGYSFGFDSYLSISTKSYTNWLKGVISQNSYSLKIRGENVILGSSRYLKRDIKPFVDFDRVLDDLIATPLFTYRYKGEKDFPEKERMGIIAEELPENLQIKDSDESPQSNDKFQMSHPDWPSIYGSFLAGIKSLYQKVQDLKEDSFLKLTSFHQGLEVWKKEQDVLIDELYQINLEIEITNKRLLAKKKELAHLFYELLLSSHQSNIIQDSESEK